MAKATDMKITVELDPESKELLRRIADALENEPEVEEDLSFADEPKRRLIEQPYYRPYWYSPPGYWYPTITSTTATPGDVTLFNADEEVEDDE